MKSNNTHLNILASFAYLGLNKRFTDASFKYSDEGVINLMIDSGAFTLFNASKKRDWLNLESYSSFLHTYGHKCEKYVMLDVIGNDHQSKKNYELMLKNGLNPMFVFTMADNDYSYLKDAVKNNEHICVAGGVTTKGDWMTKRFQDVYNATNAKIHGLGYVTYPKIYQLPLCSVDSSSWNASEQYGIMSYFNNGLKGISYKLILKKQKPLPLKIIEQLEMFKITPKQFSNINNHKGIYGIGNLISICGYIDYQKLSKIKNINLFLAVANVTQLNRIVYVNEKYSEGKLTYEEFKKTNFN